MNEDSICSPSVLSVSSMVNPLLFYHRAHRAHGELAFHQQVAG